MWLFDAPQCGRVFQSYAKAPWSCPLDFSCSETALLDAFLPCLSHGECCTFHGVPRSLIFFNRVPSKAFWNCLDEPRGRSRCSCIASCILTAESCATVVPLDTRTQDIRWCVLMPLSSSTRFYYSRIKDETLDLYCPNDESSSSPTSIASSRTMRRLDIFIESTRARKRFSVVKLVANL